MSPCLLQLIVKGLKGLGSPEDLEVLITFGSLAGTLFVYLGVKGGERPGRSLSRWLFIGFIYWSATILLLLCLILPNGYPIRNSIAIVAFFLIFLDCALFIIIGLASLEKIHALIISFQSHLGKRWLSAVVRR